MKKIIAFWGLLCLTLCSSQAYTRLRLESLLDTLDYFVAHQRDFDERARDRIKSNQELLTKAIDKEKLPVIQTLGQEYTRVNIDSAFIYFDLGDSIAAKFNDSTYMWHMRLLRYQAYPLKSMLHNALNDFESIDPKKLDKDIKQLYYNSGYQIYTLAKDLYVTEEHKKIYAAKVAEMIDSLLNYTDPLSLKYKYYDSKRKLSGPDGAEAVAELKDLLQEISPDDPVYARMSADIAGYYTDIAADSNLAQYYLSLSAISDIRTGNAETTSLHRLGKLLYDSGDIDRAYRYLTHSLDRSVKSGAHIRALEIAQGLPVVLNTARERQESGERSLIIAIVALGLLAIVLLACAWHLYYTRRNLAKMRERLEQSHDLKDAYTRQILLLCGAYISELESFNKIVGRKLKAKQYTDLLDMIESGKVTHSQIQMFFDVFDSAFLGIYPDFVSQVQKLFKEGQEPATPTPGTLNTELRLLAFMRMGIDDTGEIAKFLGLSVNTVYSYRNKMKNRAKNREDFDAEVRRISALP